jgi:FixJ family two-component response regulator
MSNNGRGKATNGKGKNASEALVSVVDDDSLMRSSTRRLLRANGFRVEAFASAEEFLASDLLTETACLILDLRMPDMNGLELQKRLAEISNPVPIIFLSAHASAEDERRALQAGAVQFLHKPVGKDVLLFAVQNALKISPNNKRNTL